MLHVVTTVEVTPPLYFVLIWGWAKVFGHDPATLRAFSALCGIALVPVVFIAGRRLVSLARGADRRGVRRGQPDHDLVLAGGPRLHAADPAHRRGSGRLRPGLAGPDPGAPSRLWALLAALAVMTHFFAGFAVAPQAVALLWRRRSRAPGWAAPFVAAAQLAMLPFAVSDTAPGKGTGWIARVPLTHRIATAIIEWGASTAVPPLDLRRGAGHRRRGADHHRAADVARRPGPRAPRGAVGGCAGCAGAAVAGAAAARRP